MRTREEEIKQAASAICENKAFPYEDGFIAGAKWADEHPKNPWISVEDRLPIEECDYDGNRKYVLVKVVDYDLKGEWIERVASYSDKRKDWRFANFLWLKTIIDETGDDIRVTHWMPIPELQKGE